jgi:hypothetical protein
MEGFGGTASFANETDGWFQEGHFGEAAVDLDECI